MVDFQSRDTSRGVSDDEDEESADEGDDAAASEAESAGENEPESVAETDHDVFEEHEEGNAGDVDADPATGADKSTADSSANPLADPGQTEQDSGTQREDHGADASQSHHGSDARAHDDHDARAHHHHDDVEQLGVVILTVSSSRSLEDDESGDAIQDLVQEDGHSVVTREIVEDDLDGVQRTVLALTGRKDVDVVVTTGGTGVTPDDVTIEAVKPLFDKELPGFGELFRILSFEEVGTRALGTRATAGISEGVAVFCLPGSADAVRLGVEELVLAEASHLVGLARQQD